MTPLLKRLPHRARQAYHAGIPVDADLLALAEHREVGILELVLWLPTVVEASLSTGDDGATCEDGDVFEHLLAAVAEAEK